MASGGTPSARMSRQTSSARCRSGPPGSASEPHACVAAANTAAVRFTFRAPLRSYSSSARSGSPALTHPAMSDAYV